MNDSRDALRKDLDNLLMHTTPGNYDEAAFEAIFTRFECLYPEEAALCKKNGKNCDIEAALRRFYEKLNQREREHYKSFYDLVISEITRLKGLETTDYRSVKALAACYELQDYLAGQLAQYDGEEDC